jgi:UDP-2,3-diacylglucosamine hydrolase
MIAIIAGTGTLPLHACKALEGKSFFIISLFPEDNLAQLQQIAPSIEIIQKPFYKAHAILKLLKEKGTTHILFIGKVDKQHLLKRFKLDWFAIKLLASLVTKSDFSIMNKIEDILHKQGISLLYQNEVLQSLFVEPGVLTGTLTKELEESIQFGLTMANKMSELDIGQTVVIKDKMILAVEAIEGTDACIKRGIALGEKGIIVCKSANVGHNKKFDLPTIGSETIKDVQKGEIQAIAWISNQTFIADKEAFVALAKKLGITLVSV